MSTNMTGTITTTVFLNILMYDRQNCPLHLSVALLEQKILLI
jgi:hypothetical protein